MHVYKYETDNVILDAVHKLKGTYSVIKLMQIDLRRIVTKGFAAYIAAELGVEQ